MNHRERFLEILDFLKPYQKIWQNEIMLMYPNPFDGYPMEWIEDLRRFKNKEDVIRLEKKDVFDFIETPSLISFYRRIEELSQLPPIPEFAPLPEDAGTFLFMIPKKQHEIKKLAPVINQIYQEQKVQGLVDIGGGVGLLAQTLANKYDLNVTSLDMDPVMQEAGRTRHEKNPKIPVNKVNYKTVKVSPDGEFPEILSGNVMPVGLHTCGRLALDIIKVSSAKKVPALINFGCCYQTLNDSPGLQNISAFSQKQDALHMHKFALTLACRAHRKMSESDYDLKQKVKFFRYGIHVLLHDHYGIEKLVTLGNSHPRLYDESFGHYALEQFKRLELAPHHTKDELNAFFHHPDTQILLDRMITGNLLRNTFGRVLELYLLLDRAIYLEEQGYQVEVQEFFEEELSPRNIGITAKLPV